MPSQEQKFYQFDDFRLHTEDGTLWRDGAKLSVTQKAIEMLVILLDDSGRVVPREAIIEKLWPDTFVDENNLSVTVSMLRKAMADRASMIETIPRKGYRFNGEVSVTSTATIATREYTRTVIERTEIDEGSPLIDAKHTGNRPYLVAAFVVMALLMTGIFGWSYITNRSASADMATSRQIAVMPFRELTPGDESKQFALGLTDSLITKLSGLKELTVRPTSAVLPFADGDSQASIVRERLKVDNFLEGTIQRENGRVRVNVQFVRAVDGTVLWADIFEEKESDILRLQDLIAAKVFSALRLEVSPKQKEYLARRESTNAEANSLYLKGRFYWNKRTAEDLKTAVEYFELAVAKDPTFALGFVGLSDSYQMLSEYGGIDRKLAMEKARAAVTRAIELNPEMGEAYCSLAYLKAFYDWDMNAADENFKKAVELSPNYATVRQWFGEYLLIRGRPDEAMAEQLRAAELDPLSPIILTNIAAIHYVSRDYEKAIEAVKRVDEIAPRFPMANYFLAMSYEKLGRETDAIKAYYAADSSWLPSLRHTDESTYLTLGMRRLAERRYKDVTTPPLSAFMNGYQKAMGAVSAGDKESAFRHLEESFTARDRWFVNLRTDPHWDPIRNDPRFEDLLRRAHIAL